MCDISPSSTISEKCPSDLVRTHLGDFKMVKDFDVLFRFHMEI